MVFEFVDKNLMEIIEASPGGVDVSFRAVKRLLCLTSNMTLSLDIPRIFTSRGRAYYA